MSENSQSAAIIEEGGESFVKSGPPSVVPSVHSKHVEDSLNDSTCTEEDKDKGVALEKFCCEEVQVPPLLPHILKTFTKAAIRTQPSNLVQWSAAYFRAMAKGEVPPVKDRIEYPTADAAPSGLTRGLLRVLHKQMRNRPNDIVSWVEVREKWMGVCLKPEDAFSLMENNGLDFEFLWSQFVCIAAASIAKEEVVETMRIICETMSDEPDGTDPCIPVDNFIEYYTYIATRAGVEPDVAMNAVEFLTALSEANFGRIGPKEFVNQECPPLF